MLDLSLVGNQPEVMYPRKTGVPCTLTPSDHVMGNLRDAMRNLQQISCNMDITHMTLGYILREEGG